MGGKSKLADYIISKFPENYDIYVEPFLGAGNVFFRIPLEQRAKTNIINDLDEDIYITMKGLQEKGDYIDRHIDRKGISKKEFEKIKHKKDPISIILKFKYSFFGNGKYYANYRPIKTDYKQFEEKLKGVIILNLSFEKFIKKYDSKKTFFYLDPPYESEDQKDYKDYVTPEEVYNVLKKIKGKFMLSYNDSPNIRELFKSYNIEVVSTSYIHTQIIKDRKVNELLIKNY
jgi:DNA adenine methylase